MRAGNRQECGSEAAAGGCRAAQSLAALTIAEMQIALIAHGVTRSVPIKSEVIAAALLASTRATLSAVESLQG